MFGLYSQNLHANRMQRNDNQLIGHDRMNYMNPTVNYDKPARKIKPRKKKIPDETQEVHHCSCMNILKLTPEQLNEIRENPHENEDCTLLQRELLDEPKDLLIDSTMQQGADVLTRMFTCLTFNNNNNNNNNNNDPR